MTHWLWPRNVTRVEHTRQIKEAGNKRVLRADEAQNVNSIVTQVLHFLLLPISRSFFHSFVLSRLYCVTEYNFSVWASLSVCECEFPYIFISRISVSYSIYFFEKKILVFICITRIKYISVYCKVPNVYKIIKFGHIVTKCHLFGSIQVNACFMSLCYNLYVMYDLYFIKNGPVCCYK